MPTFRISSVAVNVCRLCHELFIYRYFLSLPCTIVRVYTTAKLIFNIQTSDSYRLNRINFRNFIDFGCMNEVICQKYWHAEFGLPTYVINSFYNVIRILSAILHRNLNRAIETVKLAIDCLWWKSICLSQSFCARVALVRIDRLHKTNTLIAHRCVRKVALNFECTPRTVKRVPSKSNRIEVLKNTVKFYTTVLEIVLLNNIISNVFRMNLLFISYYYYIVSDANSEISLNTGSHPTCC